jgi:hypothetical protein
MNDEIIAFRQRWALVNATELQELRDTPIAVKARQTAALMESGRSLGWLEAGDEAEELVRERWNALRENEES